MGQTEVGKRGARRLKVLIADDSFLVRQRLSAMLAELEGLDLVAAVADGVEAVTMGEVLRPDVVILDIRMPGRNGIEALEQMKSFEHPPVVIILTNYPGAQYYHKCASSGADFFLDKSTEFHRVTDILRGLLEDTKALS